MGTQTVRLHEMGYAQVSVYVSSDGRVCMERMVRDTSGILQRTPGSFMALHPDKVDDLIKALKRAKKEAS